MTKDLEAALKCADELGFGICRHNLCIKVLAAHIRTQSSELALMKAVVEAADVFVDCNDQACEPCRRCLAGISKALKAFRKLSPAPEVGK